MERAVIVFSDEPRREGVVQAALPVGASLRVVLEARLPKDVLAEALVVLAPSCGTPFVERVFRPSTACP